MQYWIHIAGVQRGPMTLDELIKIGVKPDSYVWRDGLEDWVQAKDLEELAGFFVVPAEDPQQESAAVEVTETNVENTPTVASEETLPERAEEETVSPVDSPVTGYVANISPQPAPTYEPQPIAMQPAQIPPCPSTNLVWAIIVTILCCQVFGVIAIIYAGQVKSKYNIGDYERAVKYSERAALWCQLSIVFGLVWMTIYPMIALFL